MVPTSCFSFSDIRFRIFIPIQFYYYHTLKDRITYTYIHTVMEYLIMGYTIACINY